MIVSVATRLGNSKISKQNVGSIKAKIVGMTLVAVCLLICEAQCQFFTKSSKSIPRMGRRSVPDDSQQQVKIGGLYRRMLIDKLVDEYGPTVVAKLQAEAKRAAASEASSDGSKSSTGNEMYEHNDQPFDLDMLSEDGLPVDSGLMPKSRNERRGGAGLGDDGSGSLSSSQAQQGLRQRAKSLVMRAFNTDRLLQHLASGGSPVLSSDRLLDD